MTLPPALSIRGLSKSFGPARIITDVTLDIAPGERHAIIGPNGAGKSTLLRIMAGVDQDYIGEARPQPGIQVGYLPQEPELDDEKTVKERSKDRFEL